jgi:preprotein translocase subunit Sss1
LPTWKPHREELKKALLLPSILAIIVGIIWVIVAISLANGNVSTLNLMNMIVTTLFLIYVLGRLYGEFGCDKDFIEIRADGLFYRETPSFQVGWLPQQQILSFDMIRSIDLVTTKNIFTPNQEKLAILVNLQKGRSKLIGTRLNQKQLTEIAVAMKGSVMLSGTLKRILGEDVTLKDVVDTAKDIWKSIRKPKGEE